MAGVAAVFSIVSATYTLYQGERAAEAQDRAAAREEDLARQNAAAIEGETREQHRRALREAARTESAMLARAAGSGTGAGSSMFSSIDDAAAEHERQLAWMLKAGKTRASIARKGGMYRADTMRANADRTRAQAYGSFLSSAGSTYDYGNKAGWWT